MVDLTGVAPVSENKTASVYVCSFTCRFTIA